MIIEENLGSIGHVMSILSNSKKGAIRWHGIDILTLTGNERKKLDRDLYIADDLKKGTKFNPWTNNNPNKSWIYIGFKIYKGSGNFGPTIFYKKIIK